MSKYQLRFNHILGYPKDFKYNKNLATKTLKSNFIKSAVSDEPAVVEITEDYDLVLDDLKNGAKKMKLEEFNDTQTIDISKIKC